MCVFPVFRVFTVFNILVHVGVVLTYPILISIGTLLSVPGNAGMLLQEGTDPHALKVANIPSRHVFWKTYKNEFCWPFHIYGSI